MYDDYINNKLEKYKDSKVIVYCNNGSTGEDIAFLLASIGFEDVCNMIGGYKAWKEAGYPIWETSETDKGLIINESESIYPIIISAYVEPDDVWPGDIMLVSVEVRDNYGVSSVIADMGGIETIELENVKGSIYQGIWQYNWLVHDTLVQNYTTNISVTNMLGNNASTSILWRDGPGEWVNSHAVSLNNWDDESDGNDDDTTSYASYTKLDYGWCNQGLEYSQETGKGIDIDGIRAYVKYTANFNQWQIRAYDGGSLEYNTGAVSYTHLTLPTN